MSNGEKKRVVPDADRPLTELVREEWERELSCRGEDPLTYWDKRLGFKVPRISPETRAEFRKALGRAPEAKS